MRGLTMNESNHSVCARWFGSIYSFFCLPYSGIIPFNSIFLSCALTNPYKDVNVSMCGVWLDFLFCFHFYSSVSTISFLFWSLFVLHYIDDDQMNYVALSLVITKASSNQRSKKNIKWIQCITCNEIAELSGSTIATIKIY